MRQGEGAPAPGGNGAGAAGARADALERAARRPRRVLAWLAGLAFLALVLSVGGAGWLALQVATGYGAKILASGVFVSGRDAEEVLAQDLGFLGYIRGEVDREQGTATVRAGPVRRTAVHREGLGSALAIDATEEELRAQAPPPPRAPLPTRESEPWPRGEALPEGGPDGEAARAGQAAIDRPALEAALDRAFAEPPEAEVPLRNTRAVVVVHGGQIVAERYAEGFERDTPLLGWSMAKSVLNALIGAMVERGRLDIDAPTGLAAWPADDPRAAITGDQLLRMSSGIGFEERYPDPFSDAVTMLFRSHSAAGYAAAQALEHEPDTRWHYSSGDSNILSQVLRERFEGDNQAYWAFPQRALFGPLGMRSAVLETDAAGTFVASSFMYATARDWARFGLLYLQDGVWEGERILPEGWVDYTATPTPGAPGGTYGAHFWLNAGDAEGAVASAVAEHPVARGDRRMPSLPSDLLRASGYQGQAVVIVPSRDAVIVRLGLTIDPAAWDLEAFVADVLEALPHGP